MSVPIRCFVTQILTDNSCTITILVSTSREWEEGEISRRKMKEQYGHHLPAAVKLALDSVDFEGSINYISCFKREFK